MVAQTSSEPCGEFWACGGARRDSKLISLRSIKFLLGHIPPQGASWNQKKNWMSIRAEVGRQVRGINMEAKVAKRKLTFYWLICNVGSCHLRTCWDGWQLTPKTQIESLFSLFIDRRKREEKTFPSQKHAREIFGWCWWNGGGDDGALSRKKLEFIAHTVWNEMRERKSRKLDWKEITRNCKDKEKVNSRQNGEEMEWSSR